MPEDLFDPIVSAVSSDGGDAVAAVDPTGHDGVCFTASPQAAVFGAGTIHAYLASRRPPPQVVAGVSLGAVSAAAMQRVYREMADAAGEPAQARKSARWRWFRKYVEAMSTEPFELLWKGIPDQSDFFADMIPIRDGSIPAEFANDETAARRDLYLNVKLGRWLSMLPVSVRLAASAVVNYVRAVENYPWPQRAVSLVRLLANAFWFMFVVTVRVCLAPQFFPEHRFRYVTGRGATAARPSSGRGLAQSLHGDRVRE